MVGITVLTRWDFGVWIQGCWWNRRRRECALLKDAVCVILWIILIFSTMQWSHFISQASLKDQVLFKAALLYTHPFRFQMWSYFFIFSIAVLSGENRSWEKCAYINKYLFIRFPYIPLGKKIPSRTFRLANGPSWTNERRHGGLRFDRWYTSLRKLNVLPPRW